MLRRATLLSAPFLILNGGSTNKKAFVYPELCNCCTQSAGLCPEVYQMEGTLAVAIPGDIPPDQVPLAVDAANACPVSAIRVE